MTVIVGSVVLATSLPSCVIATNFSSGALLALEWWFDPTESACLVHYQPDPIRLTQPWPGSTWFSRYQLFSLRSMHFWIDFGIYSDMWRFWACISHRQTICDILYIFLPYCLFYSIFLLFIIMFVYLFFGLLCNRFKFWKLQHESDSLLSIVVHLISYSNAIFIFCSIFLTCVTRLMLVKYRIFGPD